MIHTPNFQPFATFIRYAGSFLSRHKVRILVSVLVTVSVISVGTFAMRLRSRLISQMNASQHKSSFDVYYATRSGNIIAALPLATPSSDILGTSSVSYIPNDTPDTSMDVPTLMPFPTSIPNPTPFSTYAPVPTSGPLNCAGTATSANSQVYVSSSTTQVNTSITISIEMRDCNNALASNDNLRITQQTGDATAKANDQPLPISIQVQNGKATFTVTSQTAGTDTFIITDTNQNFTVTMPGYHNPSVTFTNNTSGNSNCTTAGGVPNSWYSDVYPNPPVTTTTGSQQMLVILRDCNKSAVSSDTIQVSVNSGDTNAQINGGASPQTFSVQNGQGNFTVSSQINGTVTLLVQDTTTGFTITDPNNHNPSIAFSSPSSSGPTPTPVPTDTPTPTTGPTTTPNATTPTPSSTPTSASAHTATPTPASAPSPTPH